MLLELHIENFTIIDRCTLNLSAGMTVLTGETGAGKSILVDALGFVLGGRADSKYVRHSKEQADISANFVIPERCEAMTWLNENGFVGDTHDSCLLRRVITREGRSKAYINGVPATIAQLKSIGSYLVNIHGQHEHYALLKREHQLTRLDHYAGHDEILNTVASSFHAMRDAQKSLQELKNQQTQRQARFELLSYQVEELKQLSLGENELESLHQEQQKLAHAQELMGLCSQGLNILYEGDQETILSQLNALAKQFTDAARLHKELQSITTLLNEAIINVRECSNELRDYYEDLSLDPERLQQIEARLEAIYKLARKHKIAPETLYTYQQTLESELKNLANIDTDIEKLTAVFASHYQAYLSQTEKLEKGRSKAAKSLSKQVTQSIQELGMDGGQFTIEFEKLTTDNYGPLGTERITFMVSTNPGQPSLPMLEVVSGGELSRIGLAIQVLTAERSATPTLIFDEVDVGIGGGTAEVVGKLLRKLAEHCQVLCVTHLPQVAAQAGHHIYVEKCKGKDSTVSKIQLLNDDGRTQELARMLGGIQITEHTLAHARDMLIQAKS